MRSTKQKAAVLLLAVFAVGGLLSPLAHRISHIHALQHEHGEAAEHFSPRTDDSGATQFFVEERTLPHELNCDLCARLTLHGLEASSAIGHLLELTAVTNLGSDLRTGSAVVFSRIRAPPAMA